MIPLILLAAIALQVFLTAKKMSPFLSLLIVAILAGLALGMNPSEVVLAIEKGVGSTLGGLALIICLGAVLGKILEASGAAEQVSKTLINSFGIKNIQWAMLLTGFLVGLPLYYNAGFVILVPLVFSIARSAKLPLLYVAIPMAASLSTTHCFLPPHPGPVVLVNAFNADMGKTLMYGIGIAIPAVLIAGIVFGKFVRNMKVSVPQLFVTDDEISIERKLPPALTSFSIALLPIILITLAVIATYISEEGSVFQTIFTFIGDPTIALLFSVLVAIYYLGIRRGDQLSTTMNWLNSAISGIAMIVFIITAGGVLKQVIIDSGAGDYIASFSSKWQMPPLIFGWLATALLRVTIGSATVAGITAAGIVAPLAISSGISPELMVLAVGAGSVFGSHINDSGFWMFKEFFGLTLKQTFLSWTIMETIISVAGLIGVLLLQIILF
jgi:Gnt-I system high-affinity gluconate transporter